MTPAVLKRTGGAAAHLGTLIALCLAVVAITPLTTADEVDSEWPVERIAALFPAPLNEWKVEDIAIEKRNTVT